MKTFNPQSVVALALAVGAGMAAAADRDLSCTLKFTSRQWSAVYSSAEGEGTVSCDNGTSMPVTISAKGVGLTAGKWKITDGTGKFTRVTAIEDVLGSYLAVSGDAGAAKAGTAQALTKGNVSLALAGKGEGFDLGIAVSQFKISKP
jgi:hypothetical protein